MSLLVKYGRRDWIFFLVVCMCFLFILGDFFNCFFDFLGCGGESWKELGVGWRIYFGAVGWLCFLSL